MNKDDFMELSDEDKIACLERMSQAIEDQEKLLQYAETRRDAAEAKWEKLSKSFEEKIAAKKDVIAKHIETVKRKETENMHLRGLVKVYMKDIDRLNRWLGQHERR